MRALSVAVLTALAFLFAWSDSEAAPAQPATAGPCASGYYAGGVEPKVDAPRPLQRELCFATFALLHDGGWREPVWVVEHLTSAQIVAASHVPRACPFHAETALPAAERATSADYDRSGYDKGHQAPDGDMPDEASKDQSCSLANLSPQRPELNRKVWYRGPESITRQLALKDGEVFVVTGPEIGASPKMLNGRVAVPLASWKALFDPKLGAVAWVCPNDVSETCRVVSIAELHALVGVDPFPALPDAVKAKAAPVPPIPPVH